MKGTHEAFIILPGIGNAFVTGIPDKCDHDDKLSVFILSNGKFLFEEDCRCPTSESTFEFAQKKAEQMGATINGGTCACSKCRKVLSLAEMMGAAYWD